MNSKISRILLTTLLSLGVALLAGEKEDALIDAAKNGDVATVGELLSQGVSADARTDYGVTPLTFAADRGHTEIVRLLLEHGADPNVEDSFYGATPFAWACRRGNQEVVKIMLEHGADISKPDAVQWAISKERVGVVELLLARGAAGAENALLAAVKNADSVMVQVVLASADVDEATLSTALAASRDEAIMRLLAEAGAEPGERETLDDSLLRQYSGSYMSDSGFEVSITASEKGMLQLVIPGNEPSVLSAESDSVFRAVDLGSDTRLIFSSPAGKTEHFTFVRGENRTLFRRAEEKSDQDADLTGIDPEPADGKMIQPANWPSFRGPQASGVADGQHPPLAWDAASGMNLSWKTKIPGLSHASPVVWEDHIFVTTAVSSDSGSDYRVGLYGDVASAQDTAFYEWYLYCLDRQTGKVRWRQKAYEGVPRVARHTKATHANSSPATDGRYVVGLFGSEGLACYDLAGDLIWKKDLGLLDAGWFYDDGVQWGHASSPVIYQQSVIVQCDRQEDSYLAAFHIATGEEIWRTKRNTIPSWGTPTLFLGERRDEVITNGSRFIRSYDPASGKELWRVAQNSEIAVATPVLSENIAYVTVGYPPVRSVTAVRVGGDGDLTLPDTLDSSVHIPWRKKKGGTYMPTPIVYRGLLYTCSNNGIVFCYDAATGEIVYRERLGRYAFSASPIAADGKIYFTSEEGTVLVVGAGSEFELLAKNSAGEVCMATPAVSGGHIYIRGQHHLFAFGEDGNGGMR